MRVAPVIELKPTEEQRLRELAQSNTATVRDACRAAIVLLAAQGMTNQAIAQRLCIGRARVGRWRARYARAGLAAIRRERPRSGRSKRVDARKILRLTTQTKPANATHWGARALAAHTGYSESTIRRVWRAHGLKPHRLKTFSLSRDPRSPSKNWKTAPRRVSTRQSTLRFSAEHNRQPKPFIGMASAKGTIEKVK